MMKRLISRLREKAGKDTVIIIDEYDSAITAAAIAGNPDLGCMRSISDDFYKVIKAASGSIRLLFITGCVRLANLSVFSAINNLRDISMDPRFAAAFGYTDEELSAYFGEGIDGFLASHPGICRDSFAREIREYYDGYRFSPDSEATVYNPVSIGEFFINGCSFMNYWIRTGSSRLAVSLSMNYLLSDSGDNPFLDADSFATFDIAQIGDGTLTNDDIKALLYFSGYLTIKSYEHPFARLGFPNQEVRRSFLSDLVARYTGRTLSDCRIWFSGLIEACMSGRPEQVIGKLTEYFDAFSFELTSRDPERAYQLCFQSIFVMASLLAISEDRGAAGRSDEVIMAGSHIWIFELKVDGSADAALRQIEERRYSGKYGYLMKPGMQLHRLGISFSSRTRSIEDWKCC